MNLKQIFPKASNSFLKANAAVLTHPDDQTQPIAAAAHGAGPFKTKSEAEFADILEAMKIRGEIAHYVYQGITLRYANGQLRYTPDFVVFPVMITFKLIEVKGRYVPPTFWQHARQRFLACKAEWPEFLFEMHQKTADGWCQIL